MTHCYVCFVHTCFSSPGTVLLLHLNTVRHSSLCYLVLTLHNSVLQHLHTDTHRIHLHRPPYMDPGDPLRGQGDLLRDPMAPLGHPWDTLAHETPQVLRGPPLSFALSTLSSFNFIWQAWTLYRAMCSPSQKPSHSDISGTESGIDHVNIISTTNSNISTI